MKTIMMFSWNNGDCKRNEQLQHEFTGFCNTFDLYSVFKFILTTGVCVFVLMPKALTTSRITCLQSSCRSMSLRCWSRALPWPHSFRTIEDSTGILRLPPYSMGLRHLVPTNKHNKCDWVSLHISTHGRWFSYREQNLQAIDDWIDGQNWLPVFAQNIQTNVPI